MSWMTSHWTDKPRTCAICGGAIAAGEPRSYNTDTKGSAHPDCVPKSAPIQPTAIPPPGGPVMSDAARGHAENMASAEATRLAIAQLTMAIQASNTLQAKRNELLAKEVKP